MNGMQFLYDSRQHKQSADGYSSSTVNSRGGLSADECKSVETSRSQEVS
jgi:hypothetical protein